MTDDIKLPLERLDIETGYGDVEIVCACRGEDVAALERAYTELQDRCANEEICYATREGTHLKYIGDLEQRCAKAEQDRDELARNYSIFQAAYAQAERELQEARQERDDAHAALTDARAAAASAAKVHASQVAELTRLAKNWEASHAGQERNTLAFLDDLERVTKERDEARARENVVYVPTDDGEPLLKCFGPAQVAELMAEVERLKEQLALMSSGRAVVDTAKSAADEIKGLTINALSERVTELMAEVERLTDELKRYAYELDQAATTVVQQAQEMARLKRIKAAQEAWERIDPVKHGDSYTDACGDPSYVAAEIGAGRGPKGEVKP